jgi:phage terminase small subunit
MTTKQERFIAEYCVDLNATQAAIRAGYSPKTAAIIGWENLRKPEIQAALATRQAQQLAAVDLTAVRVLQEVARVAFANGRNYWGADGRAKHPKDLTVDEGAALATFEALIKNAAAGDGKTDTIHMFRLHDKVRALELLMKHLRLLDDHIEIVDPSARVARLEAARTRLAAAKAKSDGA